METIMITGASGLLGKAVVKRLMQEGQNRIVAVCSGKRKVEIGNEGGVHPGKS